MRSGTCLEAATDIGAWLQFAARRMLLEAGVAARGNVGPVEGGDDLTPHWQFTIHGMP